MKETTNTSSNNFKYYPAGQLNRNGEPRQSSFIVINPAMIANHTGGSKIVKNYSAFGILADQLAALFANGVKSVNVEFFYTREKRYNTKERVIQMCKPVIKSKVIDDIELIDPDFTPPMKELTGVKCLRDLLKNLQAPSDANATANTKSANIDPDHEWI